MADSFKSHDAVDAYEARAAQRIQMLDELAEMGMQMAQALRRQSAGPRLAGDEPADVAFERISRSVRLTLVLKARVEAERAAHRKAVQARAVAEAEAVARALAAPPPAAKGARMLQVIRARRGEARKAAAGAVAEAAILARAAVAGSRIDVARLKARLTARLDDRSDDAAFADAPLGELAARLCRQIGFRFDPRLWSEEEWLANAVKGT